MNKELPRNKNGLTEEEFLAEYNPGNYNRPSVTSDMMVLSMDKKLDSLKVLLIQRNDHPYINCWALPGGFVNIDESCHTAACRELKEETGLTNVYLEQLYTMSQPKRDPRMRIISVAYMALIPTTAVKAGDDASNALWFDVTITDKELQLNNKENNINIQYKLKTKTFQNGIVTTKGYVPTPVNTGNSLAFDHAEVILEGLLRLRNKIEYSDIAFNLLPPKFTLPDLQRVYEIILNKELYKSNFKASMLGKIEPLRSKGPSIVGNKMSTLYRYRGN